MRPTEKLKTAIMAMSILLSCGTANAQHWHWHSRPYRTLTLVARPNVALHVSNHFTQRERFKMAMAYLKDHEYLTVKKFMKMTGLSKAAAKAELDAFAADKEKPITAIIKARKKVCTLNK